MAGTRTAPTFALGGQTYTLLTLYMIDSTGDVRTESFRTVGSETPAQIETFIDAYQDVTQSSVYRVDSTYVYRGDEDPSNGLSAERASVSQGLNMLFRDSAFRSETLRVVAPENGLFTAGTDEINPTNAELAALAAAWIAITSYDSWVHASYSERKETNKRTRI